jgi:hypothetical protein
MPDAADDSMVLDDGATPTPSAPAATLLSALLGPLLALIQPTPLSFPPPGAPSVHAPTISALGAIHVAALECLNNAFLALAARRAVSAAPDARRAWDAVWAALGAAGTQGGPGQERRMQLWGVGADVLWAIGMLLFRYQ